MYQLNWGTNCNALHVSGKNKDVFLLLFNQTFASISVKKDFLSLKSKI